MGFDASALWAQEADGAGRMTRGPYSGLFQGDEMGGGACEGSVVVFDDADFEITHKTGKASFVAVGIREAELGKVGGKSTRHAASQIDPAKGQLDQGQIATNGAEDPCEKCCCFNSARV